MAAQAGAHYEPHHINQLPGSAGTMCRETGFTAAAQLVLSNSHVDMFL